MGNNIWERRQPFVFFRIPNLCFSTLASPEILVFLRTYEILMIINHFPLLSHRIVGGCINHFVKKKIWSFSIYCRCLLYCALSSPTLRLQSIAEWTYAPHIEGSVRDLISKGGSRGRVRGFGPLPSPSHQTYGFRYYLSEIAHHHSTWSIRSVLILRYCVVIWFLGKEKFCVLGIKFEPPSLRKIPESGLNIKGFEFIIIYSTRIWRQSNWSQAGQTQCSKLVLLKENFRLLHSVVSKVISPPLRYTLLGWQYEVSRSSLAMEQILIRWDGLVRRTTKVQ